MNEYDEECLLTFLEKQSQLFDEPVAEINAPPYNVQFYNDSNCSCYTNGGDYGYWQS